MNQSSLDYPMNLSNNQLLYEIEEHWKKENESAEDSLDFLIRWLLKRWEEEDITQAREKQKNSRFFLFNLLIPIIVSVTSTGIGLVVSTETRSLGGIFIFIGSLILGITIGYAIVDWIFSKNTYHNSEMELIERYKKYREKMVN